MRNNEELSKIHIYLRKSRLFYIPRKCYAIILGIRKHGFKAQMRWVHGRICDKIAQKRYYKCLQIAPEERQRQMDQKYVASTCFSILVPLYNTPEKFLREMIESVQHQTYGDWELCLVDGSDAEYPEVGEIVKEYQQKDSRIKYHKLEKNGGISENTNACVDMAEGDYVVLFDHDDLLHECALYELKQAVDQGADFIYTDEAVFSKNPKKPDSYHFKQDFAPDDLRSNNYICHITCFARTLLDQIDGMFRKEYDGSQDFDLVLRLTEKAEKIVHIPKVLYFWRNHALSVASDISAKTYCIDAGKKAIESHLERMHIKASVQSSELYPVIYRVKYELQGQPYVSVILSENSPEAGRGQCEQSIRSNTSYTNYEILVRTNGMKWQEAVAKAKGDYLLFMDSDCICRQESWLEELLSVAQRRDVGAVAGVVRYPKNVIRDAGITLGVGYYGLGSNNFYLLNDDHDGFWGNFYYMHNVSAVSDTCMMVRREYYDQAGGMDDNLTTWFAGFDLSLKLRQLGKFNVVDPYARIGFSHNNMFNWEAKRNANGEYESEMDQIKKMKGRWGDVIQKGDPYYNINLTKNSSDFILGSAVEKNRIEIQQH